MKNFHLSLFSLICVADTLLFSFHLSLFSLICVADTLLFSFHFSPFTLKRARLLCIHEVCNIGTLRPALHKGGEAVVEAHLAGDGGYALTP